MKGKITLTAVLLLSVSMLLSAALPLLATGTASGNNTIQGVNGYIVVPSAEPAWNGSDTTVTTGYSAMFGGSVSHMPYLQIGLDKQAEIAIAAEISGTGLDLLLNGKWRFTRNGGSSLAIGFNGQLLDVTAGIDPAVQIYGVSTFTSTFIDWPAKTTVLLGYTIDGPLDSNIDFGMGFQTPLLKKYLNGQVDFVLDYGNFSYSVSPSVANAGNRGMLNVGFRLLPVRLGDGLYLSSDVRGLDVFDASGRALSVALGLSYQP
ncbi:MAG: hypothetical protein K9M84_09595 [Spirochaetia bacterium]|nr:hypothetical protein [Spirochaetia bacterium]